MGSVKRAQWKPRMQMFTKQAQQRFSCISTKLAEFSIYPMDIIQSR